MEDSRLVADSMDISKSDVAAKKRAKESWQLPVVSFAMNNLGPLAYVSPIIQILGMLCLIKTFINIGDGKRGLVKHAVAGTIFYVWIMLAYAIVQA